MIIQEHIEIDGRDFIHTHSDRGVKIHGGVPEADYDDVYDPAELGRTYVETDIPIDSDESDVADKAEAYDILMGVSES